ncbi:MAG: trypsin-like serine protease [Lachnospiraceae bacterium]|jgi:serine protease Do|nr:trypsin-like serine protease [Lachnospiraceae bacterium]
MYDYENKTQQNGQSTSGNGEYRYSGPFYQDQYKGSSGQTAGTYTTSSSFGEIKKPKKKKWPALIAKTVCVALIFGVVASAAFQTTNYIGAKIRGEETVSESGTNEDSSVSLPPLTIDPSEVYTNGSSGQEISVSGIVENCMPSLVAITNVSVAEVPNYWGFWGGSSRQQEQTSTGTGIIIGMNDTELLLVTNNHVIANAKELTVVFSVDEGNEETAAVAAKIKGADESKDLAVIAVNLEDIPDETLSNVKVANIGDSSSLKVGEQVVAIGNALGYGQSVTTGIISALGRNVTLQNDDGSSITNSLIQTDAAINPGNSGGALLNMNGEVIGINEAKYSYNGVEGMGYAIPISDVESIISDLSLRTTRDKVAEDKMGFLGVTCQDVTEEISRQFDMPRGVYVSSVTEGSGAEKAGIRKGDIITKFDHINITTYNDLKEQLSYFSAGEAVEIVVQSPDGAEYVEKTVEVTLSPRSDVSQ